MKQTKELAYLLGSLCGDAQITDRRIRLSSMNMEFIDSFKQKVNCFLITSFIEYKDNQTNLNYVQFTNRDLIDFIIDEYGYMPSKDFVVPLFIQQTDDIELITYFLKSLFDSDGSVKNTGRQIRIQKISFSLYDVKKLFDKLNIESRMNIINRPTTKGNIVYELSITGKNNLKKFSEKVGFDIKHKQERLNFYLGDVV